MQIISEPKGKAREYAELALNIYRGCTFGCQYCHNGKNRYMPGYFDGPNPKKNVLPRLRSDAKTLVNRYHRTGQKTPAVQLSFVGDPYQPAESDLMLTRSCIEVLIEYDLPFTILTKGGTRACRDFDLLAGYPKCSFGTTLVFMSQNGLRESATFWEPRAASVNDRVEAILRARELGIKTWVSLEPVIDPEEALQVVRILYDHVDHWKIGKINHCPEVEKRVNWLKFRSNITELLNRLGADYYLKKSLSEL